MERDPARREDLQRRRRLEQLRDVGERRRQVLEVVDHDERPRTSASAWASVAIGDSPCSSSIPSAVAMLGSTSAGSATGARSTNGAPPIAPLAASARVVFPVPPGPVSVTSRVSSRPSSAVTARARAAAADQLAAARRSRRARRLGRRGRQRRVVLEDAPLEARSSGERLEAELVERVARVAVRGERVRLAARAVERDDPLRLEPLAVRVRDDERLELADERRVASASRSSSIRASSAASRFRRAAPQPPARTARRRGRRARARARARAPRGAVRVRLGEPLEALDVELVRLDADEVAGRTGHDSVGAERTAERMDVHLERVRALAGGDSPQIPSISRSVETASFGWRRSCASSARGLEAAERHRRAVVVEHLQRPQQAEFQALRPLPALP